MKRFACWMTVILVLCSLASIAVAEPPAPPAKPKEKVKELTEDRSGTRWYRGVVEKVDADGLTLVETTDSGDPIERRIVPIDLLAKGELLPDVWGSFAYRWKDIKRGDTVLLDTLKDDADGVTYCMKVCINRRPGAKLPESQNPKQDRRYAAESVKNDIENGADVSDEDIAKAFPPEPEVRRPDGKVIIPKVPGGLSRDWQAKLDAIRAKKKDDPKAKSIEKK